MVPVTTIPTTVITNVPAFIVRDCMKVLMLGFDAEDETVRKILPQVRHSESSEPL